MLKVVGSTVAPPWDSEVSRGDRFSLDRQSPIEILSLDSTDSTLVDSPRWNDSLFLQFLRSPSPDTGAPSRDDEDDDDDEEEKSHVAPASDMPPTSANAGKGSRDDQKTNTPPEGLSEISIRLRVKPDPPSAPPRTKIVLRCPARKRLQQRTQRRRRKTKSAPEE